jgi:hypothetical protein
VRVLVACEFSGVVRDAFLRLGHDAWSCDLLDTESSIPNRHIKGDVRPLLRETWDLVISHPPCTYLCRASLRWMKRKGRVEAMREAADFFMECYRANARRVCVENPIMHLSALRAISSGYVASLRPSQVIGPWMFGHPAEKETGLWLRGLTRLRATCQVYPSRGNVGLRFPPSPNRWKDRSRTYPVIAEAMATQWG